MAKANVPLLAFNRGEISASALARVDVSRVGLSAETQVNWFPKTQGAMKLRPGLGYLGSSKTHQMATWIDFVAATDETALLEITDGVMRVWIDDALVSRPSVATTISNGTFASSTGWTPASTNTSGGTPLSYGASGVTLNAINRGGLAKVKRTISVAVGDRGIQHALNISVTRGPVVFRCGSVDGADDYIAEASLRTGDHSLSFTPAGDFFISFQNDLDIDKIVASIAVDAAGIMEIAAPWASADLGNMRWDQSADVVFVACQGYQQRRIERRSTTSWSVVVYAPDKGPFDVARSAKVKLKVAALHGNTTLTADSSFFRTSHVGAIFRLFHGNQYISASLAGNDQYCNAIRVSGLSDSGGAGAPDGGVSDRNFTYSIAGTWVGRVSLYRSVTSATEGFRCPTGFQADGTPSGVRSYTGNVSAAYDDGSPADNSIIWYRFGFDAATYTSGAAKVTIQYPSGGGGTGFCRVVSYVSATVVNVEILQDFLNTTYTDDWQEGLWSDRRGWPSSVAFHEGARLWWFGNSQAIGSVSDDYENFDAETEGDAGPIIRSVGSGPVDVIHFGLSLDRLMLGTAGQVLSVRSSSFDEPLTNRNMTARDCSTQGVAALRAVKIDNRGIFVQRSGQRVFELALTTSNYDYVDRDLTLLHPDLAADGIAGLAVQRQPDTRLWVVLADGTAAALAYNPAEDLQAWFRMEAGGDGFIEKIVVLPGMVEDQVYFHVRRTVNGSTVRYLEKLALESECAGGTLNKQADCFMLYSGAPATTISGLGHLEGEDVVVWGDGADRSPDDDDGVQATYTVAGGQISGLPVAVAEAAIGLPYEARYKSTKLAYAAQAGTALSQPKRVDHVGLILGTTHNDGVFYGPDFDTMDPLPRIVEGQLVDADEMFEGFDGPSIEFPGDWSTDSRLCLKAKAPRPAMILAAIVSIETSEKL